MATTSPGATRKLTSRKHRALVAARIAEIHRIERELAAHGARERKRLGRRGDARLDGQELADARGGPGGLRNLVPHFRQLPERAGAEHRVEDELQQRSARHAAGDHVLRAEPQHDDDAAEGEEQRRGGDDTARLGHVARRLVGVVGGLRDSGPR